MTPLEAVREAAGELAGHGIPSPRVDSELLVSHVLGLSRTTLYSSDRRLDTREVLRLRSLVERRRRREPLAYILGEWGFRRLTLAVDGRVLVPRPETEIVVERCLARLRGHAEPRVLDIGAGSGAIALAIADEHRGARVTAVERSPGALDVARENLGRTGLAGRVELVEGELLAGREGPYDLVVSNPPYVPAAEFHALQPQIRLYEPREALLDTGLLDAAARAARDVLEPGGWLVLECGQGRARSLAEHLRSLLYDEVGVTPDLAGRDRVVEARWNA